MEDLVEYSLDTGCFDRVATLDIAMGFISQLVKAGRNEQALRIVKKVV